MQSRWTRRVLIPLAVITVVSAVFAVGLAGSRGESPVASEPLPEAVVEGSSAVVGDVVVADPDAPAAPVTVTNGYGRRTSASGGAAQVDGTGRAASQDGDGAGSGSGSDADGGSGKPEDPGADDGEGGAPPSPAGDFDLAIMWWNDTGGPVSSGTVVSVGDSSWRPSTVGERQQGLVRGLALGKATLVVRVDGSTVSVPIVITSAMRSASERDAVHVEVAPGHIRVLGNPVDNFDRVYPRD